MKTKTLLAAGCLILSGCATIPAVTTTPLVGQTPGQIQRDERDCAKEARPTRSVWSPDGTAMAFEGCMIARSYRVDVQTLGVGRGGMRWYGRTEPPVTFTVEATREVTAPDASAALRDCQEQARREISTGDRLLYAFVSVGVARPSWIDEIAAAYAACMEPRGYKTSIWAPAR